MKLHVTANPSNCWFNLYRAGAKHSKRIALQEPIIETGHVFWTHIYALNCVINHRMQTFETKIIFRWFIQLQMLFFKGKISNFLELSKTNHRFLFFGYFGFLILLKNTVIQSFNVNCKTISLFYIWIFIDKQEKKPNVQYILFRFTFV